MDGTIVTPDGPDSWPSNISKRQWLVFYRVNGMALKGAGVIDGRGQKWWDLPCKPHRVKSTTLDIFNQYCNILLILRDHAYENLPIIYFVFKLHFR